MYQIWRVVWNNLQSQSERSIFYDYQLRFFSHIFVETLFRGILVSERCPLLSTKILKVPILTSDPRSILCSFAWNSLSPDFEGFFFTSSYLVCFYIPVRPELHCRWLSLPLLRNFVHMNLQSGYRSKRLCNLAWLWFTKDTVYAGSRIRLFTPVT